jgi:hypothetical protein
MKRCTHGLANWAVSASRFHNLIMMGYQDSTC